LGENLLDTSHLPFAHHSVGGLKRELGGPLPMRMLSHSEKVTLSQLEKTSFVPRFQVEIVNPAEHDPVVKSFAAKRNSTSVQHWSSTSAFYDPCHVRHSRRTSSNSSVELFLCPTSEGRSRVFLCNAFESVLPSLQKKTWSQKLQSFTSIASLRRMIITALIKSRFDPRKPQGHLFSHQIFDGDGIFLHKQGNRMHDAGLSYTNYSTPSSADILLNAYRRFLDTAATQTRRVGHDAMANAVVGSSRYTNDLARSVMLDRYQTHTVHCPVCRSALEQAQQQQALLQQLHIALQGSVGASWTAFVGVALWKRLSSVTLPHHVLLTLGGASLVSLLMSTLCSRLQYTVEKKIQRFIFEDYVHAEKP
jgi:hypothetical protein